jgi:hypothetical protein
LRFKRLVVVSDLHCGHIFGLTPPDWRYNQNTQHKKLIYTIQQELWDWFEVEINKCKPINYCVCNGDAVEGPGKKNEIEISEPDMYYQEKMATHVLKFINPKEKFLLTYGTPYHVVSTLKHENVIADNLGTEIATSKDFEIYGKSFNIKHHTSKSSIAYGQGTLIQKRAVWELLRNAINRDAPTDFVIRSHIHEYILIQSKLPTCITTPALQASDTLYGMKFDSWYDIGFIHIDIWENGSLKEIVPHIVELKCKKNKREKLC